MTIILVIAYNDFYDLYIVTNNIKLCTITTYHLIKKLFHERQNLLYISHFGCKQTIKK